MASRVSIFLCSLVAAYFVLLLFYLQCSNSQNEQNFECPNRPIVTVLDGGRLGNKIWEYASAWSLARTLNRTAYVPMDLLNNLHEVFENLSFTTPFEDFVERCNFQMGNSPIRKSELPHTESIELIFEGRDIVLAKYIALYELLAPHRDEFRNEFRFKPEIMASVRKTIKNLGGQGKTLIGIHVRRTDYAEYLTMKKNSSLVDPDYFKNAMRWYQNKLSGPLLFLIVSDDPLWCKENLLGEKDVKIASKSPSHDLALMSVCNHTIIDYGTFGISGAFLSKGHSITLGVSKSFAEIATRELGWTVFSTETLNEVEVSL